MFGLQVAHIVEPTLAATAPGRYGAATAPGRYGIHYAFIVLQSGMMRCIISYQYNLIVGRGTMHLINMLRIALHHRTMRCNVLSLAFLA